MEQYLYSECSNPSMLVSLLCDVSFRYGAPNGIASLERGAHMTLSSRGRSLRHSAHQQRSGRREMIASRESVAAARVSTESDTAIATWRIGKERNYRGVREPEFSGG